MVRSSDRRRPRVLCLLFAVAGAWRYVKGVPAFGPSIIKTDPDGDLWLLVDNDVYELSSSGEVKRALRAKELGFDHEVIDFAIAGHGDVFIGEADVRRISLIGPDGIKKYSFLLPAPPTKLSIKTSSSRSIPQDDRCSSPTATNT